MKVTVNVDKEIYTEAQSIYESIGIDFEIAVRMLLKRTIVDRCLPLATSAAPTPAERPSDQGASVTCKTTRRNIQITRKMVEEVWRRFVEYRKYGGDVNEIAAEIQEDTGMNSGSAFIYLTILGNLISGRHNTRNMKMADLEFYVEKIKNELGKDCYENTKSSLRASLPYWNKEAFGLFAMKVQNFLDSLD